jgi:hypothetical protein
LFTIRAWSFAELKRRSGTVLGRVLLVHFAIIGGMFFAAAANNPQAFFLVFGSLKTLSDIASQLPVNPDPPLEVPRWFLWFARKTGNSKHWKTGQDIETWWRESTAADLKRAADDELFVEPADRRPKHNSQTAKKQRKTR